MSMSKKYTLAFSSWDGFFCVPQEIADRHLKLASHTALKVLLYVLRHGKINIDAPLVAADLGINESDVDDALIYWCGAGILAPEEKQNTAVKDINPVILENTQNKKEPIKAVRSPKPNFSGEDVANALAQREDLQYLLAKSEEIFAHPLSNGAIMTLFTLCEWDGISVDIICMVMERCLNEDRLSMSNIAAEARRWNADGIKTIAQADSYIIELDEKQNMYGKVKSVFGINNRNLSKKERTFIDSWRKDFGFDINMISLGFEACVNAKGAMSFAYINSILNNWHAEGIATPEAVQKREEKFKSAKLKKNSTNENVSYDLQSEAKKAFSRFE